MWSPFKKHFDQQASKKLDRDMRAVFNAVFGPIKEIKKDENTRVFVQQPPDTNTLRNDSVSEPD